MRMIALVPGGIDQQLLFFPTLEDLKTYYPEAMLDAIVEPRAKGAYRVCPHVHEVLAFDYRDRNGLADYLNLLGTIRDREYDVAFTLSRDWTLELLLWLNGIPRRVGYKTKASWFLSHAVPLKEEQYAAYQAHDLLQGLGLQSPCPPLKITVPKGDIDWAEGEQQRLGLTESGYILLAGGSPDSPDSSYPPQQWQEIVADIQQKQPEVPIILLSNPETAGWVGVMRASCPNLQAIAPPDVGKLAAAIAGANLLLCEGGAPLQLAVAVGTYTFALLGSTPASRLLPPAQDRYLGIQSPTGKVADLKPAAILAQIWRS